MNYYIMFKYKSLQDNKVCISEDLSGTEQTLKMTSKVVALFLCVALITWMAADAWPQGRFLCLCLFVSFVTYLQHLYISRKLIIVLLSSPIFHLGLKYFRKEIIWSVQGVSGKCKIEMALFSTPLLMS